MVGVERCHGSCRFFNWLHSSTFALTLCFDVAFGGLSNQQLLVESFSATLQEQTYPRDSRAADQLLSTEGSSAYPKQRVVSRSGYRSLAQACCQWRQALPQSRDTSAPLAQDPRVSQPKEYSCCNGDDGQ